MADEDIRRAKQSRDLAAASQANSAEALLKKAQARQKELDALLAQANQNIEAAGGTVKPKPFTQPMTIAGQTSAAPKLSATEKAAKQTADAQAAAPKPTLTDAEKAAGYTIQWVRTGVAGAGEWRKIKPMSLGATGGTGGAGGTGGSGGAGNAPIGTPPAFVYNSTTGKWEMPPKPTQTGSWVWDNIKGWVNTTVNPSSTGFGTEGGPTLAKDTFKNTLALFFGAGEMSQGWVDALYKVVSGYVNTGSDIDAALNLSLQDVRNNPALTPFTKRFQGLYALQDRLAKGEAIEVPTIAEFFKAESAMGDVLRGVGLGELATQDFLGNILGRGKSVLEVTNLIDNTFKAIDNAPAALKADLQTYFPGVDRTAIAKALLTGKEGWQELDRKVRGITVLSAAKTQGIDINLASATDIADLGYDYTGALGGFQRVQELQRGKMLGQISGMEFGQEQAIGATFRQDAKALADIEKLSGLEAARFAGSSGRLASRSRAQGAF